MSLVKFITHGMPKSSLFLLFMPIFHRIFFTGNAAIRRRMVFLLKIPYPFLLLNFIRSNHILHGYLQYSHSCSYW